MEDKTKNTGTINFQKFIKNYIAKVMEIYSILAHKRIYISRKGFGLAPSKRKRTLPTMNSQTVGNAENSQNSASGESISNSKSRSVLNGE